MRRAKVEKGKKNSRKYSLDEEKEVISGVNVRDLRDDLRDEDGGLSLPQGVAASGDMVLERRTTPQGAGGSRSSLGPIPNQSHTGLGDWSTPPPSIDSEIVKKTGCPGCAHAVPYIFDEGEIDDDTIPREINYDDVKCDLILASCLVLNRQGISGNNDNDILRNNVNPQSTSAKFDLTHVKVCNFRVTPAQHLANLYDMRDYYLKHEIRSGYKALMIEIDKWKKMAKKTKAEGWKQAYKECLHPTIKLGGGDKAEKSQKPQKSGYVQREDRPWLDIWGSRRDL